MSDYMRGTICTHIGDITAILKSTFSLQRSALYVVYTYRNERYENLEADWNVCRTMVCIAAVPE